MQIQDLPDPAIPDPANPPDGRVEVPIPEHGIVMGYYGDFKVLVMTKTDPAIRFYAGYVNAHSICRLASKEFRKWRRLDVSTILTIAISKSTGIHVNELMATPDVSNKYRGTYVHPDLLPHIASWASPDFAAKLSRIIRLSDAMKVRIPQAQLLQPPDAQLHAQPLNAQPLNAQPLDAQPLDAQF